MKCQNLFSEKTKRKKYFNMLSAENFTQRARHSKYEVLRKTYMYLSKQCSSTDMQNTTSDQGLHCLPPIQQF